MKHLWRNACLLLAALLMLLTVALAADSADNPIGLRILEEKETITVTLIPPDSDETITYQEMCNIGTITWDHVEGAKAYTITITKDGGEPVEHAAWQNAFSLNGAIEESGSYQLRVAALDAQGEELSGKSAAISWTYTMPERLPTPSITVDGAIGTISCSSSLVDYYEIEFYQNGEFLGSTTTEPEEPQFSMPQWAYEEVQGDGAITCCAVACTGNMLEASDSLKSAPVEIALPQELPPVEGIRILTREETHEDENWLGEKYSITLGPGCVVWNERDKNSYYDFAYYRVGQDGEPVTIYERELGMWYFDLKMGDTILTSGTYYVMVREATYELGYVASEWRQSEPWTYTQAAPLATPTNLRWDGTVMRCDPVAGADEYAFRVYYRASSEAEFQQVGATEINALPESDSRYLLNEWGNGEYRFAVSAVSNNILEAVSSPYSAMGPTWIRDAQPLSTPTGFRIVTQEETITYEFEGNSYTETLYPGYLTWVWDDRATEYYAEIYDADGHYVTAMKADMGAYLNPTERMYLESGTYRITLQARDESGEAGNSPTAELTYAYNPTLTLATPQVTANGMHLTITMPDGQGEMVREYIVNQQITWEGGEKEYNWISNQPEFTVPDNILSQYPDAQSTVSVQARSNDLLAYRDSDYSTPLALSAARLSTPTDLKWVIEDGTCTGAISFKVGQITNNEHQIRVYEQSRGEVYSMYISYQPESDGTVTFDSTMEVFDAPGTYYFTVTSVPEDNSPYISSETATSETFVYTVENKLDAPANPVWNNVEACWEYPESVPEGNGYQVEWLIGDTPDTMRDYGGVRSNHSFEESVSFPVVRLDPAIDQYIAFRVRVISTNIMAACHSDWVQSETICIPAKVTGVWNALNQASGSLTQVQAALEKLQPAEVMQAWQMLGQEMERTIESIEQDMGIFTNVYNESGVDDGSRVVGLILSADGTSEVVTLKILRRDLLADSVQLLDGAVTAVNYRAATEVTFKTENVKDELVIPVQISLPVSTDNPDQLRLYKGDNLDEVPIILADGYVRFAVADLSETYVLAEANLLGEVTVNDKTVTVIAQAPTGTTLYAASYDEGGRMRDVATAPVAEGQISYTLSLTPGTSVRVFLLDDNQMPLCQTKVIEKS